MKKELRVKRNEDFQTIITTGKHISSRRFVIYYTPASGEHDRIGISVGKKIGNAVERNKVKRQLRMMLQEIHDFSSGIDSIVIVRKSFTEYSYDDNKKSLSDLYDSVYNIKRTN